MPGDAAPSARLIEPLKARLLAPLLLLAACGGGSRDALRVGPIGYSESELAGLPAAQRERLADLTAFGLAVADERLDELGAPRLARERTSLTLQRLAVEQSARSAGLDEDELREAYRRDPEEQLTVRHLVILSERWRPESERAEARVRAQKALSRIRGGEPFGKVAAEVSEEPGAAKSQGLLPPGRRDSWVPEFWAAADALEPGQVSDVVETRYGFHVLRLEARDTVPFDDVRDEVLPRLVDLADAAGAAQQWATRQVRELRIDTAAVAAYRAANAAADASLAEWPGGRLEAADLTRYLASLQPEEHDRVLGLDPAGFLDVVTGVARNALLVTRAGELGIEPTPDEVRATERSWKEDATGLATALGFSEGAGDDDVKKAALAALGSTAQSVQLARERLRRLGPALRLLYPPEPDPSASSSSPAVKSERSS